MVVSVASFQSFRSEWQVRRVTEGGEEEGEGEEKGRERKKGATGNLGKHNHVYTTLHPVL